MGLLDVVAPRMTELGKIKLGGLGEEKRSKAGNTYRAPEKHDYFTITTLNRDARGDLIPDEILMRSLADDGFADPDGKLRQLPIALLSNEIDDVMQASFVSYVGKRCFMRSDGVTLTRFGDNKGWFEKPKQEEWDPKFLEFKDDRGGPLMKCHATFNCVITSKNSRWGGVYKLRTTSQITSSQLAGTLVMLREFTGGVLRGLPLRLVIRPMQVTPNGKAVTVYVVHCEFLGGDFMAMQKLAMDRARFELDNAKTIRAARVEYQKLLCLPGEEETLEEQAEIAAEFHPEGDKGEPQTAGDALLDGLLRPPGNGNAKDEDKQEPAKTPEQPLEREPGDDGDQNDAPESSAECKQRLLAEIRATKDGKSLEPIGADMNLNRTLLGDGYQELLTAFQEQMRGFAAKAKK